MQLRRRGNAGGGGGQLKDTVSKTFDAVKSFDVYPKLKEDHKRPEKTTSGAAVSVIAAFLLVLLFITEFTNYMSSTSKEKMKVDTTVGEKLRINIDITFHALHCAEVNLDAMDVAGEQQNGLSSDMVKTRLSDKGEPIGVGLRLQHSGDHPDPNEPGYCGNCYGAASDEIKCCNSCEVLMKAYEAKGWSTVGLGSTEQCKDSGLGEKGEGCRLTGHLLVNKVGGNFHVAMGATHSRDQRHIHQFNPADIPNFNVSHTIHSLSFGHDFPGQVNPLDNTKAVHEQGSGVHQYLLKIVPTNFQTGSMFRSHTIRSNQYSVSSSFRASVINGIRQNMLPGIFFVYELSPFVVEATTLHTPFMEFATSLFAILGGVFTVAGMINSLLGFFSQAVRSKVLSPKASQ